MISKRGMYLPETEIIPSDLPDANDSYITGILSNTYGALGISRFHHQTNNYRPPYPWSPYTLPTPVKPPTPPPNPQPGPIQPRPNAPTPPDTP